MRLYNGRLALWRMDNPRVGGTYKIEWAFAEG
jgi:hypothetical protein